MLDYEFPFVTNLTTLVLYLFIFYNDHISRSRLKIIEKTFGSFNSSRRDRTQLLICSTCIVSRGFIYFFVCFLSLFSHFYLRVKCTWPFFFFNISMRMINLWFIPWDVTRLLKLNVDDDRLEEFHVDCVWLLIYYYFARVEISWRLICFFSIFQIDCQRKEMKKKKAFLNKLLNVIDRWIMDRLYPRGFGIVRRTWNENGPFGSEYENLSGLPSWPLLTIIPCLESFEHNMAEEYRGRMLVTHSTIFLAFT